jgi:xylan 1,4-beta-xylosidase
MKRILLAISTMMACSSAMAETGVTITIDFAAKVGAFKPVHGVNNGPYTMTAARENVQKYHKAAGFPFVRLHDVPYAYGAPYAVDISAVFPCEDADADDPKSYTFQKTDAVIAAIVQNGAQVIYRLGQSIEHREKFHVNPPKDFDKWARVCVNIVRHYNEGWAGGFRFGIKRWEIWNEPDIQPCWTGTQAQFFDLYVKAAKALKAHDASLLIGGPAVTGPGSKIVKPFLAYCREQQAPLDFFSWHCYTAKPEGVAKAARQARQLLDAAGFPQAESYCTEWREMRGWDWPNWGNTREGAAQIERLFEEFNGVNGMLFCATVLTQLQDEPINIANFYTGDTLPRWGLFDRYGFPCKAYAAFPAYNELFIIGTRVKVKSDLVAAPVLAGVSADGKAAAVMVTSLAKDDAARPVTFALENLPWRGATHCEMLRADEQSDFGRVGEETLPSDATLWTTKIPGRTVSIFKLTPADAAR